MQFFPSVKKIARRSLGAAIIFAACITLPLSLALHARQNPANPRAPPTQPPPTSPAPSRPAGLGIVVIDPGHGGTDAGARGAAGITESEVVMSFAQILRAALEREGMRVVLTRQADENPTYDTRAETANTYRNAVVLTLHASSTGTVGTARAYFSAPPVELPPQPTDAEAALKKDAPAEVKAPPPIGLVRWERAQQTYLPSSARLAAAVQAEIKKSLQKSPAEPASASLRDLRSIAAPAIAIELASVSANDRKVLDPFLAPLADAIVQGIRAYRTAPPAGGS